MSQKRYRYTGKEKDEESGLYYHGARYYACWLGRWTASDPAGLVDGVNLYMYVRGNPVRLHDNDGKRSGPSPDHDVLGQLTGGPIDSTCTFNCGKSIQDVPSGGGKGPENESTTKHAQSVDPKDKEKSEPQNSSVGQGNGGSGERGFGEGNTVGAQFEKLAIKAAASGSSAGVWGWSAAAAIWETVGPEAISQIADKKFNTGEKVTAGEWVAGGLDVAGVVPALKALKGAKAAAPLVKSGDKAIVLGEGMKDIKTIAHRLQGEGVNAKWYQAWGKISPKID